MTATKAFSRVLGADQFVLVGEAGWSTVHDLPDQSELRLEAPGTYTTGNPIHQPARVQPGTEPASAFPTSSAWGYVLAGRLDYNNAFGAVNMVPRFSCAQDVSGISPGPGRQLPRGPQGADGRARLPVPLQLGVGPLLHRLLRGGPLQPDQRPRLRRGQHQVSPSEAEASCAARHASSRRFPWPRWPCVGGLRRVPGRAGRRPASARPDAARRREGRQRRRHHPRLGRRPHQAPGRLRAGQALRRSVRRRQAARSRSRQRTPASTPRSSRDGPPGDAEGLPHVQDERLPVAPQRRRRRSGSTTPRASNVGARQAGRTRQRRRGRRRRHPVPDAQERRRGDLEPPAALPRRDRRPLGRPGGADPRRPVHARAVRRGDDVPLSPAGHDARERCATASCSSSRR